MKRIIEYRNVFKSGKDAGLSELKKTYRNLVKEWHPDKFQEGNPKFKEAEKKSQEIIDVYSFLVSISSETHALQAAEYALTTKESGIEDYHYKGVTLRLLFRMVMSTNISVFNKAFTTS